MPDPVTTNVLLAIPSHGSDVDTWDVPLNADFSSVDGFIGGVQAIAVSGTTPVTLTSPAGTPTPAGGPTQSQNMMLRLTGTPTGNVIITLPLPCRIFIDNQAAFSSGGFVTLRAVGSGQVVGVPFAAVTEYVNDGTNVKFANLTPFVGQFVDYAGASIPGWISASTVPPFLNCDGSTFSAVTYPLLATVLGGTTLPDLRGVARYTLNQGTGRLTSAGSGLDGNTNLSIKTSQSVTLTTLNLPPIASTNASQAITVAVAGSQIPVTPNTINSQSGGGSTGIAPNSNSTWSGISSISGNNSISVTSTGTTSTPFGVIGTGTVAGITMIRAG